MGSGHLAGEGQRGWKSKAGGRKPSWDVGGPTIAVVPKTMKVIRLRRCDP